MSDFSSARESLKRIQSYTPSRPWREPWIEIDCPFACGGTIYIDRVNEAHIEQSGMNRDFVEGDNWIHDQRQTDHPKYVPDHHIFLSTVVFRTGPKKVMTTFMHEFAEIIAEMAGIPYDMAHAEVANPAEIELGKAIGAESEQ